MTDCISCGASEGRRHAIGCETYLRNLHGQHDFAMGTCVCGTKQEDVEDAVASRVCDIRGDHELGGEYGHNAKCRNCGVRLTDLVSHKASPHCRGKVDITDCQHMNFEVYANVCRMTDDKDAKVVTGFLADVTIKCAECAKPFQFLGLPMGIDTQGARVSVDGLKARLAISPQGAMPSPLSRMQFGINKFDG